MNNSSNSVLDLSDTDLSRELLATVMEVESESIANHSVRSFLFARLLATHLNVHAGKDYDEQILFAACILHDIGPSPIADGTERFEIDGADHAALILQDHKLDASAIAEVWDAIALHTSPGISERRSLLCHLTRGGVGLDFGLGADFITPDQAESIHRAYPRLEMEHALVHTIIEQAERTPSKAPRYSIADTLIFERNAPPHPTRIEAHAPYAQWGPTPTAS
jgi:hypothetical protein